MAMNCKTGHETSSEPVGNVRVVFFVWRDMRVVGGSTLFIRNCMEGLPLYGWRVHVLCTVRPFPGSGKASGVSCLGCTEGSPRWLSRWRLRCLERELKPSLIVFNESHAAFDVHSLMRKPLPAVNILHNCRPDRFYYENAGRLVQQGCATACVSNQTRLSLLETLGEAPKAAVQTLHLGIDPHLPPLKVISKRDSIRLAYVGRLDETQKNVMALVELTDALRRRSVPFELIIAGEGPSGDTLREKMDDLVRSGVVQWRGVVSHSEALEIFAQSDLCVLTSHYEGLPLAMLEAMGQGCIPLVPDIPCGISDVVHHGINGFVYGFGNYEQAALQVEELFANPGLHERIRAAARERAGSFDINTSLKNYADFFSAASTQPPMIFR